MHIIKVRCSHCGRTRNFAPRTKDKSRWVATCFFCGHTFKIYPKNKPARVISR